MQFYRLSELFTTENVIIMYLSILLYIVLTEN